MDENRLLQNKCIPCQGGVEPLTGEAILKFSKHISSDWQIVGEHDLKREFNFKNFKQALDFVNRVGQISEAEGHHPDIYLSWGKVIITLWTHKINGLHENDFILAAKIDQL